MTKKFILTFSFFISAFCFFNKSVYSQFIIPDAKASTVSTPNKTSNSGIDVLNKMISAIDNLQSASYTFIAKERRFGSHVTTQVQTKLQYAPSKKVEITVDTPEDKKGTRVVWEPNKRGGKAEVFPNGVIGGVVGSVNLDPTGSKMMPKGFHHPITRAGFVKIKESLQYTMSQKNTGKNIGITLKGSTIFNAKDCYIVEVSIPSFGYVTHTVAANENLYDIAKKYKTSEYLITENNTGIDDFFDVKAGQTLKVPNAYAKNLTLYIDKKMHLPVYQKMEDDKGMFEEYKIIDLKVN